MEFYSFHKYHVFVSRNRCAGPISRQRGRLTDFLAPAVLCFRFRWGDFSSRRRSSRSCRSSRCRRRCCVTTVTIDRHLPSSNIEKIIFSLALVCFDWNRTTLMSLCHQFNTPSFGSIAVKLMDLIISYSFVVTPMGKIVCFAVEAISSRKGWLSTTTLSFASE